MQSFMKRIDNERGIALITVLLISMVVAVISVSAAMVSSTANLINQYGDRQSKLEAAADAGIDLVRSTVNGDKTLYPASGYRTFEDGAAVTDAAGVTIPNLSRWLYAGPTGITSGQYGVFGSVVAIVSDNTGNKVVRRGEIVQESFAKFAYFTNIEGSIVFANGDQIWGPVHSNDNITINNSTPVPQAIFHSTVITGGVINNKTKAQFDQGYTEHGPTIPLPATSDLTKLATQATTGGVAFTSNTNGNEGQAETRIEFIAIDLNADGFKTGANEGFIRVYKSADEAWVVANLPNSGGTALQRSRNCGHIGGAGTWHNGRFESAYRHTAGSGTESATNNSGQWGTIIVSSTRKCFLGGSDSLRPGNAFAASDTLAGGGVTSDWQARPGAMLADLAGKGRADSMYLFPVTRAANPNFKGVIYVSGKVAISGQLRGRLTLAATSNIIIADDVKYVTDPGVGTCADMLGLFSGADVIIADNTLNAPNQATGSSTYYTMDDTRDEYIHGVVLALDNFTVQNYSSGSSSDEDCGTTNAGRGCLYLSGGIIQKQRGAVGTTGGTGYIKRYSYDTCGMNNPPPYFPTTGRFARGHYYEVDPTSFSVANFYNLLTPN